MRRLLLAVSILTLLAGCTSQASMPASDLTLSPALEQSGTYGKRSKTLAVSTRSRRELSRSDTTSVHSNAHKNKASIRSSTRRSRKR